MNRKDKCGRTECGFSPAKSSERGLIIIESNITSLDHLYGIAASRGKSAVSVACAEDLHVLEAAKEAAEQNIADFIFVGDAAKIRSIASEIGFDVSGAKIVDEQDPETACKKAVSFVTSGEAGALMKGLVDTSVIMKAVLNKEDGMRTGKKLSHLAVFECASYHKLLFVTDAAINIAPSLDEKIEIIENAVMAVINLGIKSPKVALLAAKEKADLKMPVTMEIAEIVAKHKDGLLPNAVIDGPFALDNAVSEESAKIKGINSPVAGDADILVAPNIESSNILYKSLAFLGGAKNGGVVIGAKRPIILTSRADSAESKLISIALGVLF